MPERVELSAACHDDIPQLCRLLQYAIEHARQRGCLRVTLLTDGDNPSAQRFYRRQGFIASSMLPMRLIL